MTSQSSLSSFGAPFSKLNLQSGVEMTSSIAIKTKNFSNENESPTISPGRSPSPSIHKRNVLSIDKHFLFRKKTVIDLNEIEKESLDWDKLKLSTQESILDKNSFIYKLKKYPRTLEDSRTIFSYIKDFKFFNKFFEDNFSNTQPDAVITMCKQLLYEKHRKGTIIFKEDDKSNSKFYIILSGTVSIISSKQENVFVEENLEEKNQKETSIPRRMSIKKHSFQTDSPSSKFSLKTPFLLSNQTEILKRIKAGSNLSGLLNKHRTRISKLDLILKGGISDEEFLLKVQELGYVRNELSEGDCFGEKALLANEGELARRTATVLAKTDVEFLILKKNDFMEITQNFNKEKERKKKFLISVIPFLSNITSAGTLENLMYSFKEEKIILGLTLTNEEDVDRDQKIYFLIEGRCRVERKYFNMNNGLLQVFDCQICDVSDNSIIGEEILLNDNAPYKYTVTVISNYAIFYFIHKANLIMKFPKEIKHFLIKNCKTKEKIREKLYHERIERIINEEVDENINGLKLNMDLLKNESLLANMSEKMKRAYIFKLKEKHLSQDKDNNNDDFWNDYVNKVKDEVRKNKLKKEVRNKKIQNSLKNLDDDLGFNEVLEKINNDQNKACFCLRKTSGKHKSYINKNSEENFDKNKYKFNFGYLIDNEKKIYIQKLKMGAIKINSPKPNNVNLIEEFKKRTEQQKVVSERKNRDKLKDFQKTIKICQSRSQTEENELKNSKTNENHSLKLYLQSNINNNKKKQIKNKKIEKNIIYSNCKEKIFYDRLLQTKKNHARIYSARSYKAVAITREDEENDYFNNKINKKINLIKNVQNSSDYFTNICQQNNSESYLRITSARTMKSEHK